MSSRVAIATALALATALFYAISNVLELIEAEKVPDELAMRPGLLLRLIKEPRWLLGLLSDFGGYICHAAALGLATVVFVEPILATGILMSLFIGSRFMHRPVLRYDWIAAGVLSGGLALFLYEVSPTGGRQLARAREWLIAGPSAIGAVLICMALGRATRGRPRAAFLGVAAGIAFGVSALLTKALVHYFGAGNLRVRAALGAVHARRLGDRGSDRGAERVADGRARCCSRLHRVDERHLRLVVRSVSPRRTRRARTPFQILAVVVSILAILAGIVQLRELRGADDGRRTGFRCGVGTRAPSAGPSP